MDGRYKPTAGDRAYRDAIYAKEELNPFEESILLHDVSDTYLAVLISANAGPTSAGTKALYDAEIARRGSLVAKRANRIAGWSLAVAALSLVVAIVAIAVAA